MPSINVPKRSLSRLFSLSFVLAFCLIFAAAVSAWTGPSATAPGSNVSAPINVGATSQVKSGGLGVASLLSTGEIAGTLAAGYGQFRMVAGNYGSFFRNDGTNTYLLLTNSGDQYGSWNALRPFYVNNATGAVTISSGLAVNSLTVNGSSVTSGGAISLYNGTHTQADCWNISGYARGTPSGPLCVVSGTSCPAGWTRLASWGNTVPNSCGNGCAPCTTASHAWASAGAETCTYTVGSACDLHGQICTATVAQVGCY